MQRTSATLPSSGASTGISIFIDYRMTNTSPAETVSPGFFSIFHTVPVMWAGTSTKVTTSFVGGFRRRSRKPFEEPGIELAFGERC